MPMAMPQWRDEREMIDTSDIQGDACPCETDKLIQGVIETIDLAETHKIVLSQLDDDLQEAFAQVQQSSVLARQNLQNTFAELRKRINEALDTRLSFLDTQITRLTSDARDPLVKAEEVVKEHDRTATAILDDGLKLLMSEDHAAVAVTMKQFMTRSRDITTDGLPDVPALCDVSYITAELPPGIDQQVTSLIDVYGHVMAKSPVQIVTISEQPGGLVITWAETDEDQPTSFGEFSLEYCCGAVGCHDNQKSEFTKAYKGPYTSFTLRHLKPFTQYSMRVCGRVEDTTPWCAWSVPASAMTRPKPYVWREGVSGFSLSNENKMACKDGQTTANLYSAGRLYTCGHSVAFRIVDVGASCIGDGIALTIAEQESGTLIKSDSLFVDVTGCVFIDGVKMLTRLPALTRGALLTFDTEVLEPGKVRVSIDVAGKIVTFDWVVSDESSSAKQEQQTDTSDIKLFFVMSFRRTGWKVGVE